MEKKIFNSSYVMEIAGKDNPSEILCQQQKITEIGDLSEVLSLRKVDLSFNPLSSLQNLEQLNQLRHLTAYCCHITDINCLCGIKRLETLMIQQNGISSIPPGVSLQKLRELRLDRNQLSSVEPLSSCSNLRKLNISWNNITSFEGLSGLQNLQELSASHNSISSLKHLRALPSLIEVDVSHNQLTDLQGLQLIPTLQVFHAEHNRISTLIIPQTFFTHLSKELDKGDSAKGERKTALRSSSSSSSASNASKAESRSEARSGRGRGGRVGKNVKDKEAKETVEDQKEVPNVPQVGLPSLLELYLSGNMITTLKGFDAYGTSLDVLDLTYNSIQDSLESIISTLSSLKSLSELKLLEGNRRLEEAVETSSISYHLLPPALQSKCHPSSPNSSISASISYSEVLPVVLPSLRRLDTNPILKDNENKAGDSSIFHTWEDGISVSSQREMQSESKIESVSDEEKDEEDQEPVNHNPLLIVTTVMSKEEIELKETVFRGLLERSKARLIEAVKAFVPPTDPVVNTDDNDQQNNGQKVLEVQKDIPVEKNSQKKGIAKKKSSDILEAKSATISPRPTSAQSTIRVKIGSSTSEPQLVASQNAPTRGVGFDCRSQRLAKQQEKPPDLKITLETSSQEIIFQRDEEKKIDIMTPIQRGGLQSSEELRRPKIDDDESIQWKKLTELEESKIGLSEGMMPSTLDTAIDWQHVQDISYHDEDDEDDERNSDPLYSPRYTPITQAEFTRPPFSREKGAPLRTFQVPSLQSFLRESNDNLPTEKVERE